MRLLRRFPPSPAMVIASVALLIALGGTGYAAFRLPANSVTTVQVKNHSLLARDFKAGQLPRGAAGPTGPPGPAGPAGPGGPAGGAGGGGEARARPGRGRVGGVGGTGGFPPAPTIASCGSRQRRTTRYGR